jgi:hypothetical protein
VPNHLEHLTPGGKRAAVHALVFIDREHEFEQFVTHFPFFGSATQIAATPTRPAPTIHGTSARPTIDNRRSTITYFSPLRPAVLFRHV